MKIGVKILIGVILLVQSVNMVLAFKVAQIHKDSRYILAGTGQRTPIYFISSSLSGPRVMVVGGVHGDEVAGILAAYRAINLSIEKGSLSLCRKPIG